MAHEPQPPRFIAVGECMVEMARLENGCYRQGFAGDTFNTAWYMRHLAPAETDVLYVTAVGDDAVSRDMLDYMEQCGIRPHTKTVKGTSVGLYMISLQDGERSFSYWRATSAARRMAADPTVLPDVGAGDIVFCSGITIAILLPETRSTFLDWLSDARAQGATVCFDPNLRPRLWPSVEDMCNWITATARLADIALPSHDDEARFFGDADPNATAERYRTLGAKLVVVKDGANAVTLQSAQGEPMSIPTSAVDRVVDSTAAGDAFNAGFLSDYIAGIAPIDAVQTGSATARQVITQHGALVPLA